MADGEATRVDRLLDCRGKSCPGPVIELRKAVRHLDAGDVLEVLATDKGAVPDFTAWCEETGNTLLDWRDTNGVYTFHIRKDA